MFHDPGMHRNYFLSLAVNRVLVQHCNERRIQQVIVGRISHIHPLVLKQSYRPNQGATVVREKWDGTCPNRQGTQAVDPNIY